MKNLNGKIAVVTGAGSGIGRSLAQQLAMAGAKLALCDIDIKNLRETQWLLNDQGYQGVCNLYQLDVSQKTQIAGFAQQVISDFETVDLVINNAGVSSSGRVHELTYDTLEWTININLWGVIYVTKAFLPYLLNRPEAAIVNVSSVYGLMGIPGQAAYCASKFGVRGFSEALRQEYHRSNITVSVVFPGGVKTNIARHSKTDYQISPEEYEQGIRKIEATFQTTPEEAARLIIKGIQSKAPRILIGKDARKIDFLARFKPDSYDKVVAKYLNSK